MTSRGISIKDKSEFLGTAERFFNELKKANAAVAIGSTTVQQGEMLPAERTYIARAVRHRQEEFALGRSLARTALSELAHSEVEIRAGLDRAPIWPQGIVGSISHCDGLCVAAVARRSEIQMLGVDLERVAQHSDLLELVTTVSERQRLLVPKEMKPDVLTTVCFSAKESVYKAIYPSCRRFIEFHEVDLKVDFSRSCFTARLASNAQQNDEVYEIWGRIAIANDLVMTYAIA